MNVQNMSFNDSFDCCFVKASATNKNLLITCLKSQLFAFLSVETGCSLCFGTANESASADRCVALFQDQTQTRQWWYGSQETDSHLIIRSLSVIFAT